MFEQTYVKQLANSLKAMEARAITVFQWADTYAAQGFHAKADDYRREAECLTKAISHINDAMSALAGPGHSMVLDMTHLVADKKGVPTPPAGISPAPPAPSTD